MYGVRSLRVAECEVPAPRVFWMDRWLESVSLWFQMLVIQGDHGTVLVNTGPPADLAPINDLWGTEPTEPGALKRRPGEEVPTMLANAGIDPHEITHVVLTPLQLYNTGNLELFTNAQICMSKRGWIQYHTVHEHFHDSRENTFAPSTIDHLIGDAWPRVRLLEDEDEVAPGLRTWWCGGHHRASIAVEIDSTDGVVVATDAFFAYANAEGGPLLGSSENLYESQAAASRARAVADHLVPLYDPEVFARHERGIIAPPPEANR